MRTFVDPAARLVEQCAERFAFLERELGFTSSVVDRGRALLYSDGTTGVRVDLEESGRIVVSLIRLVGGEVPPLFAYAPSHWLHVDGIASPDDAEALRPILMGLGKEGADG